MLVRKTILKNKFVFNDVEIWFEISVNEWDFLWLWNFIPLENYINSRTRENVFQIRRVGIYFLHFDSNNLLKWIFKRLSRPTLNLKLISYEFYVKLNELLTIICDRQNFFEIDNAQRPMEVLFGGLRYLFW